MARTIQQGSAHRWIALCSGLVMVIVMFSSVLLTLPASTPMRSTVADIASPMYTQNWRLFAPYILKQDIQLEVRAQWRDDQGELVRSEWIELTRVEQRKVAGSLTVSRTQKNAYSAMTQLQRRYRALTSEQQQRVRDTFIEHDGSGGFRAIPNDELVGELGAGDARVIRYLRMDYMFIRLATLYTTAAFGKDIERVQWRIVSHRVNDFHHRFVEDEQYETTTTTFGWRHPHVRIDAEVVDAFRGMIARNGADLRAKAEATDQER